ncbi:MAG: flagellar biosynthetic protein FliR [Lachnospiraceae bacterium]|nr:flagellar biosynthetic protein FliR [Lachnospiraceae bacterium]MBR5733308.1 flagellar biosynthetic protein FliR [Lachnospiraceae bacterium]
MSITLQQLEFFLMIVVRMAGFIYTAPFFGLRNVPLRIKTGLTMAIAVVMFYVLPYEPLEYAGVIGFALLVVEETLVGLILGFVANICYQILAFSGQILDMEIGFSMVNEMDPVTSAQVTVSGNMYSYAVMLMLMITYMHHYLLDALIDTYSIVPLGKAAVNPMIYSVVVKMIGEYFVLGFRIVLPVFAAMLIVNSVLAILARVAPQLSMFVIGIQLKVFVGLAVMVVMIKMIPGIASLIFDKMLEVMREAVAYF